MDVDGVDLSSAALSDAYFMWDELDGSDDIDMNLLNDADLAAQLQSVPNQK